MPGEKLPEGTDAIEIGAGVDTRDEDEADAVDDAAAAMTVSAPPAGGNDAAQPAEATPPQSFSARIEGLKGQANDGVRDFVANAKDRATDGIDDVVRMIEDAAAEVDAKIGTQYGDYIRRASGSVSGLSDALKGKDVDALFAEGRDLIKQAPGIAIGAAAAIGFVVARLARAGVEDPSQAAAPKKA